MEFIKTARGGRKPFYNGFTYIFDKKVNDTTYLRCEKRKVCKRTVNDTQLESSSYHSHPPDSAHNSVLKALDVMKARAEEREEVTSLVINKTMEELL